MFKKMVLVFVCLFASVQAQEEVSVVIDQEYQYLVYCMGMSLSEQDTICNQETAQKALINLMQDVPAVEQILSLFLMMDQEMVDHEIDSLETLIDFQFDQHYDLAMAGMLWLATYQDVFTIFNQLHDGDVSFDVWCDDMAYFETWVDESYFQKDPDYATLWLACSAMIQAQQDFSVEFNLLQQVDEQ